jgi:hypothetical protein
MDLLDKLLNFAPLFIIIGLAYWYYKTRPENRATNSKVDFNVGIKKDLMGSIGKENRHCLLCGYTGEMKTWLSNYSLPQFIVFLGLLFWIIPGLIFIGWGWKKYKCPQCGALAKNIPASAYAHQTNARDERKCPWCAENILAAAKICKHCGKEVEPLR